MKGNSVVLCIVGAYLLLMLLIGVLASKKGKTTTDFLVAGRSLGLFPMICTMAAFQIGTGIMMASAGNGYNWGFWPGTYFALGCGGGLIVTGLVSRRLRKHKGFVPLDFFAVRYGDSKAIRFWGVLSNIPTLLGLFVSQMFSCGIILETFGVPFWWGILICSRA